MVKKLLTGFACVNSEGERLVETVELNENGLDLNQHHFLS
jgi:hypothetical protein